MDEKLEILLITHKYPPSIGGMQKQSFELIQHLGNLTSVHTIILKNSFWKPLFFLCVNFLAVAKCIVSPNIRIVHANDGLMAVMLTPLLLLTSKKMTVTIHGLDLVSGVVGYQAWMRRFLPKFEAVIAVSHETAEECVKRGVPREQVHCITNGFEIAEREDDQSMPALLIGEFGKGPVLLSIGRMIERKGFSWFIKDVFSQIETSMTYVVVGSGYRRKTISAWIENCLPKRWARSLLQGLGASIDGAQVLELVTSLPNRKEIILLEHLSEPELAWLIQRADLLIMPNIPVEGDFEGFGLVALEAASGGLVPIASNVDGIPSAIHDGKNGILLTAEDAQSWIQTIEDLLDQPEQLEKLAARFKQYTFEHHRTWSQFAAEYLKIFQSLISVTYP